MIFWQFISPPKEDGRILAYLLLNADKIDYDLLVEAFQATCKKRETVFSISEIEDTLSKIKNDEPLAKMWEQFRKKNFFVGDLQWEEALQEVLHIMGKLIDVMQW